MKHSVHEHSVHEQVTHAWDRSDPDGSRNEICRFALRIPTIASRSIRAARSTSCSRAAYACTARIVRSGRRASLARMPGLPAARFPASCRRPRAVERDACRAQEPRFAAHCNRAGWPQNPPHGPTPTAARDSGPRPRDRGECRRRPVGPVQRELRSDVGIRDAILGRHGKACIRIRRARESLQSSTGHRGRPVTDQRDPPWLDRAPPVADAVPARLDRRADARSVKPAECSAIVCRR